MGSSYTHYDYAERVRRVCEEHERRTQEVREDYARRVEEMARKDAEEARVREEESRKQAEEARRRQEEAQRREEEARVRENEARQRMEEAHRAAEQARYAFEEARRRDQEFRQREEEARRREELARQLAEKNQRDAWEAQQREMEARAREEEIKKQEDEARKAADKAREEEERAKRDLAQANFCLSIGIQPEVWPTEEEFNLAKARIEYNPEKVHLAVCGSSGAGKSSLINAFRGLANWDAGAAPAGIVETTMAITRYPDSRVEFPHSHFVWFDAPGAGTLDIPGWQYFNKQGLFIFDVIVLVYDARFTQIDVAIIENCERYRIPLYIARSKSDMHIEDLMDGLQPDSDKDDEGDEEYYKQARQLFIDSTRENFDENLQKANLTKRDVFIVSRVVMHALVTQRLNSKLSHMITDEGRLLEAVLKEAYTRLRKDYQTVVQQNMVRASL